MSCYQVFEPPRWSSPPGLREDVFFTYRPSEAGLSGEELRLGPEEERFRSPGTIPSPEGVQHVLVGLEALKGNRWSAEELAVAFEQVVGFFRLHDPEALGEKHLGSLTELRARAAAADSAQRNARAALKLARAVYRDRSTQFLERFMHSVQFHLGGEPPGSPLCAALLESAVEIARLEMLADTGFAFHNGVHPSFSFLSGASDAEKFLGEQEKKQAAASRVRRPEKRHERFGPIDPASVSLLEETANAARDWARSELRYASTFRAPVLTSLAEAERRCAELTKIDSAVGRIRRAASLIAERLVENELDRHLSTDAQTLCARLTNVSMRYVDAAVSEEQVHQAEEERMRVERVVLLQKRLARMSSHPSIMYARDDSERQEAAFQLAWETLVAE